MTTDTRPDSQTVVWYFDFISPFAYLQWERLKRAAPSLSLQPTPVLFAGLLAHWGNKGPVEIAPKRGWTYAHCLWIAKHHGITMRLPAAHPFNPLPLLRLCMALGNRHEVIDRLFGFVWREGHLPSDEARWQSLLDELDVTDDSLRTDSVKAALHRNGEQAIADGVFGVPTAVLGGEIFWGLDATDMLLDRLAGDPFFDSDAYRIAFTLPSAQHRKA